MPMLWYLKYLRWRTVRHSSKEYKKLKKRNASSEERAEFFSLDHHLMDEAESYIDYKIGKDLCDEARSLDVEVPAHSNDEMWKTSDDGERTYLTPKGRAYVRKLVDQEKSRRFEIKTLWITKIILPLAGVIVGIIGAATGFIAVWRHGK